MMMGREQNPTLYDFDWKHRGGVPQRPNYIKFFQTIADAGVNSAMDLRNGLQEDGWPSPLGSIMSEILQETVAWMTRRQDLPSSSRVRFISEEPDSALLFLGSVLAHDAVVLSDSAADLWSSELPNPIRAAYWEGLLDQMLLCREPLLDGRMVLCPAIVRRSVGRGAEEQSYKLNFTSSLEWPDEMFARQGKSATDDAAPEHMTRVANLQPSRSTITVPLIRLELPFVRDISPTVLRTLFDQESAALKRLRMAIRDTEAFSEEELLSGRGLKALAERLDHEIAQVQVEYERVLRGRERLLASTGMGVLGLVLSVSLPAGSAPIAAALGAAAAGVNALNYVFAVRDSKAEIRAQKYFLAWKAWRAKDQS